MKAIALCASARQHGNCVDFAQRLLGRLETSGVETELVNFYDYRITPCQHCAYECLQRFDPARGQDAPCPIQDDVFELWRKTWEAEILFVCVPNYGGMPPALWLAFSQRSQAFFRQAPEEKLKRFVVGAVVIGAPHHSSGVQWTYSFMADEIKGMGRKVAGFEIVNNAGYPTGGSWSGLADEPEVRRRLDFLGDQALSLAQSLG